MTRKVQAPLVSAQQGRTSAEAPQSSQPPNESCGTLGARPGIEPRPHAWGTVHDAAVLRARVRTVLDRLKSPLSESSSARSVAASYKPPMLVTRVRLPACAYAAQAWCPRLTCVEVTAGWAATCQCSPSTTRLWPDPGSNHGVKDRTPASCFWRFASRPGKASSACITCSSDVTKGTWCSGITPA